MALGYENTGIGPKLIANAGNAMTESIRRLGEQVQQHIYQNNVNQQGVQYLQDVSTLDFKSPNFPAQMAGVMAKYPMASQSQGAVMGSRLLMNGWEQEQSRANAELGFNRQKELIDYRQQVENPVYGGGSGGVVKPFNMGGLRGNGFNPDATPAMGGGESEMFNAGNRMMGAMSPLGVAFNPQTEVPLTDTPSRMNDERGALFSNDPVQKAHNRLIQYGVDRETGQREMGRVIGQAAASEIRGDKPIFRNIPGKGVGLWNPETRTLDIAAEGKKPASRWLNAGTHWENVDTGDTIPIEISPNQQATIDARKEANVDRDAARSATRNSAFIKTQIADRNRDLSSVEREITRLKKIEQPSEQDKKDLGELQISHGELMKTIKGLETDLGKVGKEASYESAEAVRAAFKAGELTRDKALQILRQDFGL